MLVSGCKRALKPAKPAIVLEQVPAALHGGSDPLGRIAGKVTNSEPGAHIVLYARNGSWYVQPFRSRSQTEVAQDGTWNNVTHFGAEYAALLVRSGYRPPATLATLPSLDDNVLAVTTAQGSVDHSGDPTVLHFGGYDWNVRTTLAARGSDFSDYLASNVWVDDKGYLHLRMGPQNGQWYCASLTMTRSLGYGTYRFVISDSAHLPVSPVLSIFAHSDLEDTANKTGLRIELGQWGKHHIVNADYVVSPYYVPGNSAHFTVPAGPMTHVLRWEPGTAEFTTLKGASAVSHDVVMDHVFKSGIPIPSTEKIRLDFYDYRHAESGLQQPVEIVVQKFEYLP